MWLKALVELIFPAPIVCQLCQQQIVDEGLPACKHCLDSLNLSFTQLQLQKYQGFTLSVYQGRIKQILNEIKYHNNYRAAVVMGEILGLAAKEQTCLQCIDYLAPVPLHMSRIKQRGFNQTEAFAKGMNRVWRRPVIEVIRQKNTIPQNDLTAKERVKNMKNAFLICNPEKIKSKHVLIIDDIFTTGATFNALADLISNYQASPIGLFLTQTK
ncbi:MAG: ComF family protein [Firmicutes bacterium]|nr:ComF family protein [Bacillota bacterium]